jgi:hypothetical protein
MSNSRLRLNRLVLSLPVLLLSGILCGQDAQEVPKTWNDAAIDSLELPLAVSEYSPVHVRSDFYYAIPIRPIYKSYPAYAPGKEPPGYLDWLKQQEPDIAFDPSRLHSIEEWTRAGELVFDAPIFYDSDGIEIVTARNISDPAWYKDTGTPIAGDGTVPFVRYFIRKKGVIEVGEASCGMCHTRVMADGAVLKGAQGNFPFDRAGAYGLWSKTQGPVPVLRLHRMLYGTPWLQSDPVDQLQPAELIAVHKAIPAGVGARQRATPFTPTQIPDLIGIKDRRYLDRTGIAQHRNIGDLMRYAALNQGADDFSSYNGFVPSVLLNQRALPPSAFDRYSDEQLYALALYLYSLKPPPNPNPFDEAAKRGQEVFQREGCTKCHTPPLYTNNMLTPAIGFRVPDEHLLKFDIVPESVGTDPQLTMNTRRGTGYYKVPSLKGVWYRGPFEHMGSVATLEDWFDPRRLRDDYVPTGFIGYGIKTRAVKGHDFGLSLSPEDKKALLAFLRTL